MQAVLKLCVRTVALSYASRFQSWLFYVAFVVLLLSSASTGCQSNCNLQDRLALILVGTHAYSYVIPQPAQPALCSPHKVEHGQDAMRWNTDGLTITSVSLIRSIQTMTDGSIVQVAHKSCEIEISFKRSCRSRSGSVLFSCGCC